MHFIISRIGGRVHRASCAPLSTEDVLELWIPMVLACDYSTDCSNSFKFPINDQFCCSARFWASNPCHWGQAESSQLYQSRSNHTPSINTFRARITNLTIFYWLVGFSRCALTTEVNFVAPLIGKKLNLESILKCKSHWAFASDAVDFTLPLSLISTSFLPILMK